MNIIVCKNYDEMSVKAAAVIADEIKKKPKFVLGLATGSTPVGMYTELARLCKAGELSFAETSTVNLDEYYPIDPTNDQSYRYFMNEKLFDHIDIDKAKTHVPYGLAEDPEAESARYEKLIEELGGIDLQVLGIGHNGHIGFNEPADGLVPATHVTDLTARTIAANSRFFASEADVPRRALTMGIGTILKSKKILMLVSGADKKEALAKLLKGKLDTSCPASMINLHTDVTLICTEDAIDL